MSDERTPPTIHMQLNALASSPERTADDDKSTRKRKENNMKRIERKTMTTTMK